MRTGCPQGLNDLNSRAERVPELCPEMSETLIRLIDAARTLTDRTMLMVRYSTGMRNAEMRGLPVQDIDRGSMLIHIRQRR